MTFQLRHRATQYHYDIEGDLYFQVNGELVKAEKYHIEHDPHQAEAYAMQIDTTAGPLIYEGLQRGNWPSYVRRLFEKHLHELRHKRTA